MCRREQTPAGKTKQSTSVPNINVASENTDACGLPLNDFVGGVTVR
jgi:hypothetical protein